jgi:hypothetical protein
MANKVAYHSVVIDSEGNGTLATITVFAPGTATLSTIYSSPAGAAWEGRPIKRWTGSEWVEVDGLGG